MALLNILHFPDDRLRKISKLVEHFDDRLNRLIDDMLETMYDAPGVGLAAVQVGQPIQLIVIDVTDDRSDPKVLINPVIMAKEGSQTSDEGCLSVPAIYEPVNRAERVIVEALDRNGEKFQLAATGLLGICIQHELDHLEGIVFVDHLSVIKRMRIKKKMEKLRKKTM